MWWHGPQPSISNAVLVEDVPVRPNPAPRSFNVIAPSGLADPHCSLTADHPAANRENIESGQGNVGKRASSAIAIHHKILAIFVI